MKSRRHNKSATYRGNPQERKDFTGEPDVSWCFQCSLLQKKHRTRVNEMTRERHSLYCSTHHAG